MLDMNKMKAVQKDLDTKAGGGDGLFVNTKDLKEETDFRIAAPKANLNGSYYLEVIVWWIGKKHKIISPATFGLPDPIEEEFEAARAADNKELNTLLDDTEHLNKKSEFWVPGYFLNCEFDNTGNPTKVVVVDDKGKILSSGPQLMTAINRVVTSRFMQNGTEDGICDREKGFNIVLQKIKTGNKKTDVEYGSQGWNVPYEMDAKYYTDAKVPDVVKVAKHMIDSDDYQVSVIRNYLYGEELMEKPKKEKLETAAPAASAKKATTQLAAKPVKKEETPVTINRGARNVAATDDNGADDKATTGARKVVVPPARGARGAAAPATTGKRSLVDDNFELED